MPTNEKPAYGSVAWIDLTVSDAETVRDFYEAVAGWKSAPVSMGEYDDFNMIPVERSEPVAGVCHKRGANSDTPSQWLMYILVEDLDASMEACRARGGSIVAGPTSMGSMGRYCIIKDPADAVAALFSPAENNPS